MLIARDKIGVTVVSLSVWLSFYIYAYTKQYALNSQQKPKRHTLSTAKN